MAIKRGYDYPDSNWEPLLNRWGSRVFLPWFWDDYSLTTVLRRQSKSFQDQPFLVRKEQTYANMNIEKAQGKRRVAGI